MFWQKSSIWGLYHQIVYRFKKKGGKTPLSFFSFLIDFVFVFSNEINAIKPVWDSLRMVGSDYHKMLKPGLKAYYKYNTMQAYTVQYTIGQWNC